MTSLLHAGAYVLRPLVPADAPAMAAAVRESMASLGPWMPWAHAGYDEAEALDWIAGCDAARADGSAYEFGIFRRRGARGHGAENGAGAVSDDQPENAAAGTAADKRCAASAHQSAHAADSRAQRGAASAPDNATASADGLDYIGAAGLNQFNRAHNFCNLGYWVRASAQRQGAGRAAIQALTRFAFDQLGLARLEIVVADGNLPSLALARRAGAVHECLARNRLALHGRPVAAHVLSLVPDATPPLPERQ